MNNKLRWFVLFMVFIATGLNFLDRQVLSVVIIKIQQEFNITDLQYGVINTSFLVGYAIIFFGMLSETMGSGLALLPRFQADCGKCSWVCG